LVTVNFSSTENLATFHIDNTATKHMPMASQIYSRYIPPPKKTSTSNLPAVNPSATAIIAERALPTPPPTRQDASSTYARYVPPSKTKAEQPPDSLISAPESTPTSKRNREEVGDEPVPKRTKKDKQEKNPGRRG
jgi:ATP-dependent RNA helicase DDX51/DBP6